MVRISRTAVVTILLGVGVFFLEVQAQTQPSGAQDLRMKTVYTTGGVQKTETVTLRKGERERFEFGEVILLRQHDLKRTVQIIRSANTYMIIPDGAAPVPPAPTGVPGTPPQKPGVVAVTTTIVDTGERKTVFGLQARHAKVTMDKQPATVACDPSKQHIETDGWYVDLPPHLQRATSAAPGPPQQAAAVCEDEIKATHNGDPKVLGFPISYSTTMTGEDGQPLVVAMEITELEITNLDPALFDIPPGMKAADNLQALTKAVSDANETTLAQQLQAPAPAVQKIEGVPLIGVAEFVNKTSHRVDTRGLRARLVSDLAAMNLNATPLPAADGDVMQLAGAQGYDYVLVAEITDLKVSKGGGGIGGLMKAASRVAGGNSGQDPTEAAVSIKLVQPDGKSRLTTTIKGKEDAGLDLKTGLGVAKFAGGAYLNVMTGRLMMNALNQSLAGNLGGVGLLGNPSLLNMQTQALGMTTGMRGGFGIDPTARAASLLMQQSLASTAASSGLAGQSLSFDVALGEALQNAAKAVAEHLKKK